MNLKDFMEEAGYTLEDVLIFTAVDSGALLEVILDTSINVSEEDYLNMIGELYQEIKRRF